MVSLGESKLCAKNLLADQVITAIHYLFISVQKYGSIVSESRLTFSHFGLSNFKVIESSKVENLSI